jgi:type IV pilus assembly protein PilX
MIHIKNISGSILLLVVSILSILSFGSYLMMHRGILGSKILANQLANEEAFNIAEEALLIIEDNIISHLSIENFNSTCKNGYCFSGTNKELPQACIITNNTPWKNTRYWQEEESHQLLHITYKDNQVTAKYLIEFMCYMPKNIDDPLTNYSTLADMAMIFRITVLGINNNGSESMVQSIYKRNIL